MIVTEFNTDLDPRLRLAAELSTDEGVAKLHDWMNEIVRRNTKGLVTGPFGPDLELICHVNYNPPGFKTVFRRFFAVPTVIPDDHIKIQHQSHLYPLFVEVWNVANLADASAFAKHISTSLMMSYNYKEGGDLPWL